MNAPSRPSAAWEPITPRGVAAFAGARLGRLLLVQLIVALLTAGTLVWFIGNSCFPTIGTAIQKLPASGEIISGKLDWMGDSPEVLAQARFVAFDVDLDHSGQMTTTSDLQIEFGRQSIRVFSLFGYMDFSYPRGYVIAFNQNALEPLWGAWAAELLLIAAAGAVIILMFSWGALSTVYFLPAYLFAFYTNRDLNLRQSWRLAGAALMPGALLMNAAVLFYGLGFLNLISFLFAFGAHFIIGWICLFLGLIFLPRAPDVPNKGNPFRNNKVKGSRHDNNPFKTKQGTER